MPCPRHAPSDFIMEKLMKIYHHINLHYRDEVLELVTSHTVYSKEKSQGWMTCVSPKFMFLFIMLLVRTLVPVSVIQDCPPFTYVMPPASLPSFLALKFPGFMPYVKIFCLNLPLFDSSSKWVIFFPLNSNVFMMMFCLLTHYTSSYELDNISIKFGPCQFHIFISHIPKRSVYCIG